MIKNIKVFNIVLLFLICILVFVYLFFRLDLSNLFSDFNFRLYYKIINMRLERILKSLVFGGSLAVSGFVLQKIFSNPLVEPFTLGISGISFLFGNVAVFIVKNSFISVSFGIMLGILLNVLFLYYLFIKKFHLYKILIIGMMMNLLSISLVEFFYYIFKIDNILLSKSLLIGNTSSSINILFYILVLLIIYFMFMFYKFGDILDVMSLGEENSIYLGIDIIKERQRFFLMTSIMIGISVLYIGLVGFVGLVIPHIIRNIFGDKTKHIFISVISLGGLYLLLADFVGKNIVYPIEIPVGVIANLLGGIFLLFLLLKKEYYG